MYRIPKHLNHLWKEYVADSKEQGSKISISDFKTYVKIIKQDYPDKYRRRYSMYDPKQIKLGMRIEQEHRDITHGDPKLTRKIVNAHLREKNDYYTRLKQVEKHHLGVPASFFMRSVNSKPVYYGMTHNMRHNPLQHWPGVYNTLVKNLSAKHRDDHKEEVEKTLHGLKQLQREAWIHNRGDIWIPEPDKAGYYPVIDDIPFEHLKTAIRANSSKPVRKFSWEKIKEKAREFIPRGGHVSASGLTSDQERRLMNNFLVALPLEEGNTPRWLGQTVPGDINFGSGSSKSLVPVDRTGGDFIEGGLIGQGFTAAKFNRKIKPMKYSLRDRLLAIQRMGQKIKNVHAGFKTHHPIIHKGAASSIKLGAGFAALKLGEKIGKKRQELSDSEELLAMGLLGPGYNQMRQGMEKTHKRIKNSAYNQGLHYNLDEVKARTKEWMHDAKLWALGNLLPRTVRHATAMGLGELNQHLNLPPMMLSGETLQRSGFDKKFSGYTSSQLKQMLIELKSQIGSDPELKKAIDNKIAEVAGELLLRNTNSIIPTQVA